MHLLFWWRCLRSVSITDRAKWTKSDLSVETSTSPWCVIIIYKWMIITSNTCSCPFILSSDIRLYHHTCDTQVNRLIMTLSESMMYHNADERRCLTKSHHLTIIIIIVSIDIYPAHLLMNAPYNPSATTLLGKMMIWLVVGVIVALIIFAITILFGNTMNLIIQWLGQVAKDSSPLLWMIMLVIAFLSSMVGNMLIALLYGLMYGWVYPSVGKLMTYALIANVMLFIILAPLYAIVYESVSSLFMVLGFHTIFSVFVTAVMNETSIDSHYALSSLIGGMIGMASVVLIFMLVFKVLILNTMDITWVTTSQIKIMLSLPALIAYSMIPLIISIWQKIYSWLYDMGSNFLYAGSRGDRVQEAEMMQSQEIIEDEINVNID